MDQGIQSGNTNRKFDQGMRKVNANRKPAGKPVFCSKKSNSHKVNESIFDDIVERIH